MELHLAVVAERRAVAGAQTFDDPLGCEWLAGPGARIDTARVEQWIALQGELGRCRRGERERNVDETVRRAKPARTLEAEASGVAARRPSRQLADGPAWSGDLETQLGLRQ